MGGPTRVRTTRVIFEVASRVQVRHHEQDGYIVFDWSSFTIKLHEIEHAHEAALAAAQNERCLYYLADTSKVRDVLPQDVIQWWGRIWVPKLGQAGLRAIVTVTPTSALAALSTRSWQAEVIEGITVLNVPTFAQADAAIKRQQATTAHEGSPRPDVTDERVDVLDSHDLSEPRQVAMERRRGLDRELQSIVRRGGPRGSSS